VNSKFSQIDDISMSLMTNQIQPKKGALVEIIHTLGQKCELDRNCDTDETKYQKACLNEGKCVTDTNGNPSCDCDETYFYGKYCEHVHPCHPMKNTCGDGKCERFKKSLTPENFICHDSQL